MELSILIELVKSVGPSLGLAIFVIWYQTKERQARDRRDAEREAKRDETLAAFEEWTRTVMITAIEKNSVALQAQADASRECAHANRNLLSVIRKPVAVAAAEAGQ